MKITCESCNTRYSIPDEKIQGAGRTFKIRCKSCGEMMTVKGLDGAAAAAAPAAEEHSWYYAAGADRKGPVTRAALADLVGGGALTEQTYVWRQGMANWSRLAEVEELAGLLAAGEPGADEGADEELNEGDTAYMSKDAILAAHAGAPATEPAASEPAASEPAASEPAASEPAASEPASGGLFGDAGENTAAFDPSSLGGDLFGDSADSADSAGEAASEEPLSDDIFQFDSAPADDPAAPSGVHGRRESSVLFSLDELASPDERAGMSQEEAILTETSGLIDIRAVAKSQQSAQGDNPFATVSVAGPSGGGPSFSAVSVPLVQQKKSKLPLIISVAALLIAGGGVAAFFLTQKPAPPPAPKVVAKADAGQAADHGKTPEPTRPATPAKPVEAVKGGVAAPTAAAPGTAPAAAAPGTAPAAAAPGTAPAAVAPGTAPSAAAPGTAPAASAPAAVAPTPTKRTKSSTRRKHSGSSKPKSSGSTASVKPAPAPKPAAKPASSKNSNDVNALLGALNKKKKKPAGGSSGASAGGSKLNAGQVGRVFRGSLGKFRSCYKLMSNPPAGRVRVKVNVVIRGNGSVASSRVINAGGVSPAVKSCIARRAQQLHFPSFTASKMVVNYTIPLQ